MNLQQLLTYLRESMLDDAGPKQLWKDSALVTYINQAQMEAAIRARFPSLQREWTENLAAGSNLIDLAPDVIGIERVVHPGFGALTPIDRRTVEVSPSINNYSGRPLAYVQASPVLGAGTQTRIVPTPSSDVELVLTADCLAPELVDMDDECAIPVSRQLHMLHWAAHLAYSLRDSDAEDKARAAQHDSEFTAAFGERLDALVEIRRADHRRHTVKINHLWG